VTAHQAVENSPTLRQLAELVKESSDRLKAIESLIPEGLRPAVKAGPIEGDHLVPACQRQRRSRKTPPTHAAYPVSPARQGMEGYINSAKDTNSQKVVL
jgi:hypothetical protein